MKQEIKEKHKFIEKARLQGYWCEGLETNRPGFPDVVFRNKSGLLLIEFKYWVEKDLEKKAADLFTEYQIPWMTNYLNFSGGLVSDLEVIFCDGYGYLGFSVSDLSDLAFLKEKKLIEVLGLCENWF